MMPSPAPSPVLVLTPFDLVEWFSSASSTLLGVLVGGAVSAGIAFVMYKRQLHDAEVQAAATSSARRLEVRTAAVAKVVDTLTNISVAFSRNLGRSELDSANREFFIAGVQLEATGEFAARQLIVFVGLQANSVRQLARADRAAAEELVAATNEVLFAWREQPERVGGILREQMGRGDRELSDAELRARIPKVG